jgi:alpha-L-rhamnosidase
MVRIARVWAEHHEPDTIGIGEARPRISWSFAGDEESWEQTNYEIEIKHDDGKLSSVTIESSQSRLVRWRYCQLLQCLVVAAGD